MVVLNLLGLKFGLFWWLANLYVIAQIVPHLPLLIRRLRDAGKAWLWIFICLIPFLGALWLIWLLAQPSVGPLA